MNQRMMRTQPALPVISPNNAMMSNPIMPQAPGVSIQGRQGKQVRAALKSRGQITPEGLDFLKCAFAAPDFDGNGTTGFPDKFTGQSLAIKSRFTTTLRLKGGTDYYFLLPPIPGVSYASTETSSGTPLNNATQFSCKPYSNFNSLFTGTDSDTAQNRVVSKFRFVSNHFEMVCNTNNNNWSGNITAFKIQAQTLEKNQQLSKTVDGLNGILATDQSRYDGPFNLGIYTGAFNKGAEYDFFPIWQNQVNLPTTLDPTDFMQILGPRDGEVPGFDNNFETVVISVTGVNTDQSFTLKTWQCVEYQFTPGTIMYESQVLKCEEDLIALELYRKIIHEMPIAVSYFDNAKFWNRVLEAIRFISGGLSVLPGPYGMAARGVNLLSSAVSQMAL